MRRDGAKYVIRGLWLEHHGRVGWASYVVGYSRRKSGRGEASIMWWVGGGEVEQWEGRMWRGGEEEKW